MHQSKCLSVFTYTNKNHNMLPVNIHLMKHTYIHPVVYKELILSNTQIHGEDITEPGENAVGQPPCLLSRLYVLSEA